MDFISIALIGLSLSMDAFAVSVSCSMSICNLRTRHIFITAGVFGIFQALMPIIGYFLARTFSNAIVAYDHWVAFVLLAVIGGNMIFGAIRDRNKPTPPQRCFSFKKLLLQGVATSIDALAIGVSFAIINTPIFSSAALIGGITFGVCIAGVYIGKKLGDLLQNKAEIIGGIVLILIGTKILLEHTIFA